MKPLKVHLGCGNRKIHGWLNVDARREVQPDKVGDITDLGKLGFEPKSIHTIYACHVLEHIEYHAAALRNWCDYLIPYGNLFLSVPNFDAVVRYYIITKDLLSLQGFLHGGQRDKFDHHYHTFDFNLLDEVLRCCGYCNVKEYNPRTLDHGYCDDYSMAYLPHMQFDYGIPMSLNIWAVKAVLPEDCIKPTKKNKAVFV